MGKLMQKYLLAFLLTFAFAPFVYGAATKLTNLEVTGTLTVDGATSAHAITATSVNCSNVSTTTLTANNLVATYGITGATLTLSGVFTPYSRTISQLNALAPGAAGQFVFCSDCVRSALCVSSGTATGAWVVESSTAASPAYTTIHCQ